MTKPGIVQGNLLTCTAGFLLATSDRLDGWRLLATLAGTALIIASACVFNNYLDRHIDKHMARTAERALVTGRVNKRLALIYATMLGLSGLAILFFYVNSLTAAVGLFGFAAYVGLYSFWKRRSVHGTLVGTISGATPPVAGYTAVTGRLDSTALWLYLIMVCWQMAHFFAIAIYRHDDYQQAGLPVLPVVKGPVATHRAIRAYIVAFVLACVLLTLAGPAGWVFAAVMVLTGSVWLYVGQRPAVSDTAWGRRMFLFSLLVIMVLAVMLSLAVWLP